MKKRNRVLALTVAAAMSASLLAGCGSSAQQGGAASSEAASTDTAASVSDGGEDNINRVGVVCSMTGGSAIYGEGAQNAVDMAVEEINAGDSSYKIEIVNGGKVADDANAALSGRICPAPLPGRRNFFVNKNTVVSCDTTVE